jgi:hypothetical protein
LALAPVRPTADDGVRQIAVRDVDGKNLKTLSSTVGNAFALWSADAKTTTADS